MFRFSVDEETAQRANHKQLASHDVALDEDWEQRLQEEDAAAGGARCFRAEDETPESVDEAVAYVRGLLQTVPDRVWLGDEMYVVGEQEPGKREASQREAGEREARTAGE